MMKYVKWASWFRDSLAIKIILIFCIGRNFALEPKNVDGSGIHTEDQSRKRKEDFISYVAEWEYEAGSPGVGGEDEDEWDFHQLSPLKVKGGSKAGVKADLSSLQPNFPSKRVGPATWQDSSGSWWLFGGQGPVTTSTTNNASIQFLSDLWLYDLVSQPNIWRPIFESQRDKEHNKNPISAYPDNLAFPLLCGSSKNSHLAVFGSGSTNSRLGQRPSDLGRNSLFTDDNIVWLYDIPKRDDNKSQPSNETFEPGVWTSYICCDACLPDDNTNSNATTLDFCPHFSDPGVFGEEGPILWCSQDSLMALQLTSKKSPLYKSSHEERKFISSPSNGSGDAQAAFENKSENHSSTSLPLKTDAGGKELLHAAPSPPVSSANAIEPNKSNEGIISKSGKVHEFNITETATLSKEKLSVSEYSLNWWKFDLGATEWRKMPGVKVTEEIKDQIFGPNCRSVSDQFSVYILCPKIPEPGKEKKEDALIRTVSVFDSNSNSIFSLSQLTLNNAFRDKRIWQSGRSILHAQRSRSGNGDNQTIILLAYQKLLDLWVYDHRTGRLFAVENIWRGSTLHKFQTWNSFYKLRITILGTGETNGSQSQGKNSSSSYIIFMANPRTKLFTFNDPGPLTSSSFHITLQTDQSVFLPSRDASFLINPEDPVSKSSNASLSPLQRPPQLSPATSMLLKSTPNPFPSPKTNIIEKLSPLATTTGAAVAASAIDYNERESSTTLTKVSPENTATRLKSNLGNGIGNESRNMKGGEKIRLNSSSLSANNPPALDTNTNPATNFPNDNSSSNSEGKRIGVSPTNAAPLTSHSKYASLNKHLAGFKRSSVKGTIDPPKLGNSTSSSVTVNNENRVEKPLQRSSTTVESPRTIRTTNTDLPVTNLNYRNENTVKPRIPLPQGPNKTKPKTSPTEGNDGVLVPKNLKQNTLEKGIQEQRNITLSETVFGAKIQELTVATATISSSVDGEDTIEKNPESDQEDNNDGRRSPLIFTSSEVIIDPSKDDLIEKSSGISSSISENSSPYSSMIFFGISISFFATIGIVLFFRRCVKCPPRRQSVLLKEPPPIRYSVIPDELSYHTPIV